MGGIVWSELFPTRKSVFIFLIYMSLFVCQGIFVKASQGEDNGYSYNTVTVVLLTEILKLIISGFLYCKNHTFESLVQTIIKEYNVLVLYFVPAFLYCLYNNLAFINLSVFDPTTYYLLLQFRVVITGILFQIIFKKYLSKKQWLSLILLTAGCMIKQLNLDAITPTASDTTSTVNTFLNINAAFILVQTICSCLAGVYNEYLLKYKGSEINIYIQNVFMYLDSIICNMIILLIQGNLFGAFTISSLKEIARFDVVIIMINNAAIGIITSFFLKYLNSILKTFASALELLFTAILCFILFQIPIYMNTILAIVIVTYSVYLYSLSPVVNTNSTVETRDIQIESKESLIKNKYDDNIADTDSDIVLEMEKVI